MSPQGNPVGASPQAQPEAAPAGASPWVLGLRRALSGSGLAVRIGALSLLLLLVVQVACFVVLREQLNQSARAQLAGELQVGERIWRRLLDTHAQRMHQGATLLSADFGFRSAVASGDKETIVSALENHSARIGATVSAVLDPHFIAKATHGGDATPEALHLLLREVSQSMARAGKGTGLALVSGQPHLWVTVPLRAPVTVGWVLMSFPLGQALVDDMRALSTEHATLITRAPNQAPQLAASTLGPASKALLQGQQLVDGSIQIAGDESYAHIVNLDSGNGSIQAVLTRSVAEVTAPFRRIQMLLGFITLVGLLLFAVGNAWMARRVTGPLRSLAIASERLARGEDNLPMQGMHRGDELGHLARAFDDMRHSVASSRKEMQRLAYCDRLTGMPNRARFHQALQASILHGDAQHLKSDHSLWGRAAAGSERVAVIMLDLDRFKHVNDVLGYAVGDRLLRTVAERLRAVTVRDTDVVACMGGDKFALLLPDAGVDEAFVVAQRIASSFEVPLSLDDHTIDLSAGIGIAAWPEHGDDAAALVARAEMAMYAAKRKPEVAQVYDPATDVASQQSLSLLSELRLAVERNELRLFLQPKISLADHRVVGAEALVRWQHPQRGLLAPIHFVPFAEQTGFIRRLTLWMLEETARQWAALQVHGPLRISVNLSTRDLLDVELPNKLDCILSRHRVPASGLCLEITESTIMDDPARAEATLNVLSQRGFKLSIDDFGTGYSSLAYLRRLPVNELKIDRSFVVAMERDTEDAKIVRSTIDLAHNLGLSVVAEGIENAQVYAQLAGLGCDEGQGYHMNRPQEVEVFAHWLRQRAMTHATPGALLTERSAEIATATA
jgi:diguanylate cyclase (GGDEF)-like protein